MELLALALYMISGITLLFTYLTIIKKNERENAEKNEQHIGDTRKHIDYQPMNVRDIEDEGIRDILVEIKGAIAYIEINNHYLSVEEQHDFERINQADLVNLVQTYTCLNKTLQSKQKEKLTDGLLVIRHHLNKYTQTIDQHMLYQFERNFELVAQRK